MLRRVKQFPKMTVLYIVTLVSDYRDAAAASSDEGERGSLMGSVATLAVGAGVPLFALLNHLTPAFRELIDFRLRTILAVICCSAAGIFCALIISKKKAIWSLASGGELLIYSYPRIERLFAKFLLPVATAMALVGVGEFRYFYGKETAFGGDLYDQNGIVVNAAVDFLDRDGRTLCERCLTTDSEGQFFAKLKAGGRIVSLKVSTVDSVTECRLAHAYIRGAYDRKDNLRLDRTCRD